MCESRVIEKKCGTCRRWIPIEDKPWEGQCRLDGKEHSYLDMQGCLGWKVADPWDLEKRGYEIKNDLDED